MPTLSKHKIYWKRFNPESILFCRELQACSRGAEIFDATEKFFEEEMLQLKNCKCLHRWCCHDDWKKQKISFQS